MILSLTQAAHLEPPYDRLTVFLVLDNLANTFGRTAFNPLSFSLQSPHFGVAPAFFVYK